MRTPVTLSTGRDTDGRLVVSATGELDMSNIDTFNRALTDALTQANGSSVEVDLRGVEYLDSGAINVLFPYADRVHLVANRILMPVLKVCGLTDVMSIEPAG
ncbi:MAG TPA: STAS domain-containing protein [Mycobacterium sp.]|nr:STAS domain-containing protein [Mycobacterium sp.]